MCQSLDIRNGPEMFNLLSGCRVVEGFLQILLFDRFNETAYANLSFPELREITGYLMMYRVNGLKTLSTLFPNLAVIRGHKLFNNYAFILYEMMDMDVRIIHLLTRLVLFIVRPKTIERWRVASCTRRRVQCGTFSTLFLDMIKIDN